MSNPTALNPASDGLTAAAPRQATAGVRRFSRRVAADLVGFLDVLAVLAGGFVPAALYAIGGTGQINGRIGLLHTGLITAVFAYACLRQFRMYDTARMHDFPVYPSRLFAALGIAFLVMCGTGLPFTLKQVHLWIWLAAWFWTSYVLLLAGRMIARKVLAALTARGHFATSVAVYGAGNIAGRLDQYLGSVGTGIHFVGVYDDRKDDVRLGEVGPRPVGNLEALIREGRAGRIDQIIIALPQAADRRMGDIVRKLEQIPVSIHACTHIASDLFEVGPAHHVSSIGPVGLLDIKRKPLADWGTVVKWFEDRVLGSLLLLIALPLMGLIALAIRMDSTGPVLFRQRRRGLNQRIFEVLKFRSMTVLEDGAEVTQATRDDARVTRLGRFLRRTSLDELPQLINVVRGEMSLVGPRPHALVHDEKWGEMLESYANRHKVKPGITGWAQVNGFRGEVKDPALIKSRVEHDLHYIDNWSFGLDMKILAKTVIHAITCRNAY